MPYGYMPIPQHLAFTQGWGGSQRSCPSAGTPGLRSCKRYVSSHPPLSECLSEMSYE